MDQILAVHFKYVFVRIGSFLLAFVLPSATRFVFFFRTKIDLFLLMLTRMLMLTIKSKHPQLNDVAQKSPFVYPVFTFRKGTINVLFCFLLAFSNV